ncbi:MAG: hypothetical protein ACE5H4_08530 [Candidatus Thorarchaeota archaeon]
MKSADDSDMEWLKQHAIAARSEAGRQRSYERYKKRFLIDTSDANPTVISPLLVTTIYRDDPASLSEGDIVGAMSNLVAFGYEFQRVALDTTYEDEYLTKWKELEASHEMLKPVMICVGVLMMVAGAAQMAVPHLTGGASVLTGAPMFLFGLDMITGNTLGFSVLDEGLKVLLRGAWAMKNARKNLQTYLETGNVGVTPLVPEFIKSGHEFSFFQFHSNQAINLVLTQVTFMAVGAVLSGFSGMRGSVHSYLEAAKLPDAFLAGEAESLLRSASLRLSTFGWGIDLLGRAGQLSNWAIKHVSHQFAHLVSGTMFLFTLGAIGSAFGDAGFFAELVFQGLLMASIIGALSTRNLITEANQLSYSNALSELKSLGFLRSIFRSRSVFSSWGLKNVYRAQTVLKALSIASFGIQLATIMMATSYGSA